MENHFTFLYSFYQWNITGLHICNKSGCRLSLCWTDCMLWKLLTD